MLGRRPKPPVLARIPGRGETVGAVASLDRAEWDAFTGLREALRRFRVVFVSGDGDGSGVAAGLAAAITAGGRRAALVEADLGRPGLAARLGLDATPGLVEYLLHEAEAPEVLQTVVLAGPESAGAAEPLVCVVAGMPSRRGAELLVSEGFRHVIAKLRSAYDAVVLDGPPLEDEPAFLAVAAEADATVACRPRPGVPRRLRRRVDGIVLTGQAAG